MCTHPLELVTDRAMQVLVRVLNNGHHRISSSAFTKPEREVVVKAANHGFALVRTQHELHGRRELGCMWTRMQSEEGGNAELLEEGVALRVAPISHMLE
jgi:hypothetical protein